MKFTVITLAAALVFSNSFADTVMMITWRGCEEACMGLQDYLAENGVETEIILRDANKSKEIAYSYLEEARNREVDIIVTWGTSATRQIAGTLQDVGDLRFNNDINQVFMIVADPVGSRLVSSLDDTGRTHLTGTYNRVPEQTNLQTILAYFPAFGHLGLIFNSNEENSVLKKDEIVQIADGLGLDVTVVELPLMGNGKPDPSGVLVAFQEMKSIGVEFVYLGSSSFLRAHGAELRAASVDTGLPVLSPYEEMVRASHALISVSASYYETGKLAGRQVELILEHGIPAGDLPVHRMSEFAVVINIKLAGEIGLYPPVGLLMIAETVH